MNDFLNYQAPAYTGQQTKAPFDFGQLLNPQRIPAMGNTRMTPASFDFGAGIDFGANPGAAYGAGSGFGGDVLSKSFLANEGAPGAPGGGMFGNLNFSKLFEGFGGSKAVDGTSSMGWGAPAIAGFSALTNAMMGMKQFGLMKDQLAFAKDSFAKNWEAQKATTNSQLEDRQAARVASNAGAYQSVGEYMKKNGVKG